MKTTCAWDVNVATAATLYSGSRFSRSVMASRFVADRPADHGIDLAVAEQVMATLANGWGSGASASSTVHSGSEPMGGGRLLRRPLFSVLDLG
jgi:hypothetical protein